MDTLAALPADHLPGRDLFPVSQYLCRVCSRHNSSAKIESASKRSPPVRFFDACSLASCYHQVPMVTQVPQDFGSTYPHLPIRIRLAQWYPHHDRS